MRKYKNNRLNFVFAIRSAHLVKRTYYFELCGYNALVADALKDDDEVRRLNAFADVVYQPSQFGKFRR